MAVICYPWEYVKLRGRWQLSDSRTHQRTANNCLFPVVNCPWIGLMSPARDLCLTPELAQRN
jgi:hypothetical protein